MDPIAARLSLAERFVAECEERLARQRRLVERLERSNSRWREDAVAMLRLFETSRDLAHVHRDMLQPRDTRRRSG
jgi:hypothetical protein